MRRNKITIILLTITLLLSNLPVSAFGETEVPERFPNLTITVSEASPDCQHVDTLKDKQLSVTITKDLDPEVSITIPLTYIPELWEFVAQDHYENPSMSVILEDFTENLPKSETDTTQDSPDSPVTLSQKMLEGNEYTGGDKEALSKGYTITLNGLEDDDHYTDFEYLVYVETAESLWDSFEQTVQQMREMGGEAYADYEMPETFSKMQDDYANICGYDSFLDMLKDSGYTQDEIQQELTRNAQMDLLLEELRSGTFEGYLSFLGLLNCDCPELKYYEIYHEYYKLKDGKYTLVGRTQDGEPDDVYETPVLEAPVGTVIRAEDYIQCEYDNETYEYVGSYESWVVWEEDGNPSWDINKCDQFTIEEYDDEGLVLRYVLEEKESIPPTEDSSNEPSDNIDENTSEEQVTDNEVSPPTGDKSAIALYTLLLSFAAAGLFLKRKLQL